MLGGSRESSQREGRGEGGLVWGKNEDGLVLGESESGPWLMHGVGAQGTRKEDES